MTRNRRVQCGQGAHLREGGTAQVNFKRKNVLGHSTGCSQTNDVRRGNKIATNMSEYAPVSVGRGVV